MDDGRWMLALCFAMTTLRLGIPSRRRVTVVKNRFLARLPCRGTLSHLAAQPVQDCNSLLPGGGATAAWALILVKLATTRRHLGFVAAGYELQGISQRGQPLQLPSFPGRTTIWQQSGSNWPNTTVGTRLYLLDCSPCSGLGQGGWPSGRGLACCGTEKRLSIVEQTRQMDAGHSSRATGRHLFLSSSRCPNPPAQALDPSGHSLVDQLAACRLPSGFFFVSCCTHSDMPVNTAKTQTCAFRRAAALPTWPVRLDCILPDL
jgi:hypothetical protein